MGSRKGIAGKDKRMDFGKIAVAASYIEERLGGNFIWEEDERSEERFLAWKKLLNVVPEKNIFETRLESCGITEKDALNICGNAALASQAVLPEWAGIIGRASEILPVEKEKLWELVSVKKEKIELTGPIAALLPFVYYAEQRLKAKYQSGKYNPELPLPDLAEILLKRLYLLCAQTFNAQARMMMFLGQGPAKDSEGLWRKLEDKLLSGEWNSLYESYPVLAKRIGITIANFLNFIEESMDRFFDHKRVIEDKFFNNDPICQIEGIEGEISDLHQNGKSVLIFHFDGGRKIVYKPRPLEIDAAWEEFLEHFTTEKSSIFAPKTLNLGNYGFIEYIEHKPCSGQEELETYFYNAGAMMALVYALGGNDFHMENIIAAGTTPVIIDTETLMIPVARYFGKGGKDDPEETKEDTLEAVIDRSVMKIGLLPLWQKDGEDKRADYGGLTGDKADMKNLPVYQERKYSGSEFPTSILHGFEDMYRSIIDKKEELLHGEKGICLFEKCKFRMLIRNSQVYGNLLQHITQPALLKNGFDYSMTTDRLVNAFLYDAHESIVAQLMKVFLSEKSAVERGDIPIFYGEPGGEGILDEEGLLFDRYFERSAIDNARDKINGFRQDDLMIQLQIIEKALATENRNVHEYLSSEDGREKEAAAGRELLSREELLKEAREIYEEIMANRFVVQNGDYSWLSEQYDMARSGTSLSIMGPSLYDGLLGICVFSSALYALTKDPGCLQTAEYCLEKANKYMEVMIPHMERYQINIGYSSGLAGYIAGFSMASKYMDSEAGYQFAEIIILGITEKMIRADTVYDVLGGISGLVLALTQDSRWLSSPATKEHTLNLLKWCGEHLLEKRSAAQEDSFHVWKSKESEKPLTGLGHGMAGIAMALLRLHEIWSDERYLAAATDAIDYETSVFDSQAVNWPDFRVDPTQKERPEKQFMGGYCAGAPGIGLARLDGLARIPENSDLLRKMGSDIGHAEEFIGRIRIEGRNHLCCGSAGRIDFLIEKGLRLDKSDTAELAHQKLSELILGKQQRGHYNFHTVNGKYYYNPTLFQGTAGIGYEILRFLDPEKIRSILI